MEVRLLHLQYELALRTYVLLDGSWNARGLGAYTMAWLCVSETCCQGFMQHCSRADKISVIACKVL
jgi:hypothetical protein